MMNFSTDEIQESDIAIIAMSGRFPGAKNIDAFWENLRDGIETISWLSEQELLMNGVQPELLQNPNYVRASAVLDDIELFDANFFGINPKEAEILDPQQRLFLECAWETVEQAGYNPQTYTGSIGVYAGLIESRYLLKNLYPNQELNQSVSTYQLSLANEKDFLPTRVAYKLNLTGPAVNIQTACSTSLVAVHMACQSLVNGECDMALAGGVAISIPQKIGYLYQEEMIASPDGHCRAFDAKAQGTFRGNGVGIVMLKRAKDAIADRDYIHAIIKGSAINNDGTNKIGFTAPSVKGQADVIAEAQAIAGIDVETITYVETHGTGTTLGDPIEIAALTQAFRQNSNRNGYCAIGSLKTNMGHLDTAAGVSGLIKTVLALKHQQIPPSLNFETPNPKIDFANTPFYVNTQLAEWKTDGIKRRAGVSSFGIGGTNAHVVLEEAPILESSSPETRPVQLLVLSAKTSSALEAATNNLSAHLKQHPELNLADVAYTLSVGRQAFEHRRILVRSESEQIFTGQAKSSSPSVIFMFSGQGSQYVNMAREIYETETIFREQFDYCAELLQPELGLNLRDILYPSLEQSEEATKQLQQTAITQPALFTIEYALAKLWESWGVSPQGFIGHSIGEYVAACLAGVFSLKDALFLVAIRGRMMQQLPPGAMLSVPLSVTQIEPFLSREICLAAINEPSRCVVSGTKAAIAALENQLLSQGIESRYLHTFHAFHSQMMEPILELFAKAVQKVTLNVPCIPYISNLTGTWITAEQATNPDYWSQHLRSPVQFSCGIDLLLKSDHLLLEVGPGRTLSTFAKRHFSTAVSQVVLTSLRHPLEVSSDMDFLLATLGQLWLVGVEIDWFGFYANQNRNRLPLPTYPFERQRYWIEAITNNPNHLQPITTIQTLDESLSAKKTDIADWFYIPSWKRSILPISTKQVTECWLFFADESGFGEQLANRLAETGQKVIIVKPGESFLKKGDGIYTLNLQQRDDYDRLLTELQALQFIPNQLVHCWSVKETPVTEHPLWLEEAQDLGFYSLLYLAQALGQINFTDDCQLTVVSNNIWDIASEGWLSPEKATLLGPINVIPQEYPNITCRSIDIVLPPVPWQKAKLLDQLLKELQAESEDRVIAYRGNYRWVRSFESVRLETPQASTLPLKTGGVYLITGGMGGIGLSLAEYLAKTVQAKLILIARSDFPARSEWEQWLLTYHEQDINSRKIQKIQEMEALGAEVLVIGADVANHEQMHKAIANSLTHFGNIHGVIHAAGVPAGGIIQLKNRSMTEEIFAPKIKGTLVLDQVLQDIKLDWLILCSSLNSVQAVFGQVDYCAANAFLDAFAHYKTNQGTNTIAINWDAWQEVGMAAKAVSPTEDTSAAGSTTNGLKNLLQGNVQKWLLPSEGVDVFSRILGYGLTQVLVSTVNLETSIKQENKFSQTVAFQNDAISEKTNAGAYPRPQLSNPYVAPRNPLEEAIAQVWQQFLGIAAVGVEDRFLDLGGDSLLGTQIIAQLRERLAVKLSLASLFETPTVAEMAASLVNKIGRDKHLMKNPVLESSDREEFIL